MKERLLVTGGSGLLGSTAVQMAISDFEVFATYNSHPRQISGCQFVALDIKDGQSVMSLFREVKPDLVIHAAALVNVDYCEDHPEEAWATNVEGTENVAIATKEVGAKMIYISTDSVFDGKKGMYAEKDRPQPLNIYARAKLEGEARTQKWLPDSVIARTAFYGWGPPDSNKVNLAEWVVDSLRQGKDLKMFADVFFSPIFVGNLVEVITEMYRKGVSGMYHVGGRERCSKYTFGRELAKAFGWEENHIRPSLLAKAGLKAPRPKDLSLNVTKVLEKMSTPLLGLKEGIARFKETERLVKGE